MRMYDIIEKKKHGNALDPEEIDDFIAGYTRGEIPDYQASALLMAIYFQGMTEAETTHFTMSMCHSGETADLSCFNGLTADKHSTGGVGDKTSLIVAPLAASLGCKIAKMSGRGLGHTGGTIDKLESIPGFRTDLSPEEFRRQVQETGVAIVCQSGNFAPADKKLYALRDVTATVDSLPLIASSIMSKKLASGADHIVLDVKYGSGAFMKTREDALRLAQTMVRIGKGCGRKTAAVITAMDVPLGRNIGNALEIKEALSVLKNNSDADDLREVSLILTAKMVSLCFDLPFEEAISRCKENLMNGKALETFYSWIRYQGGDVSCLESSPEAFRPARYFSVFKAPCSGYLCHMDAERIGRAAMLLGAGRQKKEDAIDVSAGLHLLKKPAEPVSRGEDLIYLYSSVTKDFSLAKKELSEAIHILPETIPPIPLIYKII